MYSKNVVSLKYMDRSLPKKRDAFLHGDESWQTSAEKCHFNRVTLKRRHAQWSLITDIYIYNMYGIFYGQQIRIILKSSIPKRPHKHPHTKKNKHHQTSLNIIKHNED